MAKMKTLILLKVELFENGTCELHQIWGIHLNR